MLGALSVRFEIFRLHTLALVAAAATIAWFGIASASLQIALVVAALVGFFLFTSMVGLYVITPSIDPTEVRNNRHGAGHRRRPLWRDPEPLLARSRAD